MKQLSLSSGISAVLGITEPAMYGVTLKLNKPFYAAMIGGAVAGAILNIFQVKNFGMSMPGLIALAGYVDAANGNNIVIAVIGCVVAFVVAMAVVMVVGFKEQQETKAKSTTERKNNENSTVAAPVSGTIIPTESLSDQTFSEEIMGKTYAIQPTTDQIVSPVNGVIQMVAPSKHAIGIKSDEGVELLIHVGIDTVELKGEGFDVQVKEGDRVQVGEPLLKEDVSLMKGKGYDPVVLTIITNSHDFLDILPVFEKEEIDSGTNLFTAIN